MKRAGKKRQGSVAPRSGKPRAGRGGPGAARKKLRKVGGQRLPARSSSARDEKRGSEEVRLNKYLADHGVASRRAADELIEKGKVSVDGEPVTELGAKIDPTRQTVEIQGFLLKPEDAVARYYLLNKPAGVVCTNEARETRPRAVDLITDPRKGRIYTVGRLDEESRGLILLTSDGELAQRVSHPRFGVPKTYRVKVRGRMTDEAVQRVREGVHLSEGRTSGARILMQRRTHDATTLEVTLREGMNRELRRSFARVGFKVIDLERVRIGPLTVRGLRAGKWRALSREEVEGLLAESDEEAAGERRREARERARATRAAKAAAGEPEEARAAPPGRKARSAGEPARKGARRSDRPRPKDGPHRGPHRPRRSDDA